MSHEPTDRITGLPDNARRPLKPGEKYVPVVSAETGVPEVTARSVTMGLIFCAIFSMAAAYLALKVGQGIEAAIPISILTIGLSRFFARRNTLLENVIVQSIGANSSHVVAGAVFTIPALYMLAAEAGSGVTQPSVWQVIVVSFLGGLPGHPLPHPPALPLHGRDARAVPVARGDGHHGDPRVGRAGGEPGQDPRPLGRRGRRPTTAS